MRRVEKRFTCSVLAVLLAAPELAGCAPEAVAPELTDLQSLCQRSSKLQDVELYDGG